ncbi:MAG: hypothetical protein QW703_00270 [Candidatus Aenigmatarchaeota archaeon]
MLTYDLLRKIFEQEKMNQKLTKLPEDFIPSLNEYLEKKAALEIEDKWELESAKKLIRDLFDMRDLKLLNMALYHIKTGSIPENLLTEERSFFEQIVEILKKWKEDRSKIFENKKKNELIVIIKEFPDFVGPDMKVYGPFKEGDVANLPIESANILIEKGIAKKI